MSCEFCEPYHQKLIDGENGFCAITKNGELIVYPKSKDVDSVRIKIKRCPMCGRDFSKHQKQYYTLVNRNTGLTIVEETKRECQFNEKDQAWDFKCRMGREGEIYKIELRTFTERSQQILRQNDRSQSKSNARRSSFYRVS